ncbi:hypothetical protein [Streptomyces sp. NBC_00996]|uniref:hypothetical protein n=1 Tax=Streptomyces sp. NBC_00996 TaxID=2903710 RepID=UPI00386ACFD6|nr:hypothetical protein OG390_29795 [Streptomyces sp. NBC_00996]
MRSARMLLATATATAALAIGAPGAYGAAAGDRDSNDDSSYSQEHDKNSSDDSSYSKEHGNGSSHDKPSGGMHTGGGALTTVRSDDSGSGHGKDDSGSGQGKDDSGSGHDKGSSDHDEDSEDSYGGDSDSGHDKPKGGMHTGGGALALLRSDDGGKQDGDKRFDPETYKNKDSDSDYGKEDSEDSYGGDSDSGRDNPKGGMHTGGGALASTGVTAGGLAVLGVAGAGAFLLRRKSAQGGGS